MRSILAVNSVDKKMQKQSDMPEKFAAAWHGAEVCRKWCLSVVKDIAAEMEKSQEEVLEAKMQALAQMAGGKKNGTAWSEGLDKKVAWNSICTRVLDGTLMDIDPTKLRDWWMCEGSDMLSKIQNIQHMCGNMSCVLAGVVHFWHKKMGMYAPLCQIKPTPWGDGRVDECDGYLEQRTSEAIGRQACCIGQEGANYEEQWLLIGGLGHCEGACGFAQASAERIHRQRPRKARALAFAVGKSPGSFEGWEVEPADGKLKTLRFLMQQFRKLETLDFLPNSLEQKAWKVPKTYAKMKEPQPSPGLQQLAAWTCWRLPWKSSLERSKDGCWSLDKKQASTFRFLGRELRGREWGGEREREQTHT